MPVCSDFMRFGKQYRSSLLILGLVACLSSNRPELRVAAAQSGGVSLRVDVELITVEVMVKDKKGQPVRNLTRENFQLFEDGKRQDIVTFAEVSDETKPELPTSLADVDDSGLNRGKMVLILFDDSHISSVHLQTARDSAEKYVKERMRPQDFFAVASFGMSLKLLQNFTHDAAKVVEAIRQPAVSFATPSRSSSGFPQQGLPGARGGGAGIPGRTVIAGEETAYRVVSWFRALNSLSASAGPVKGRKVVLVYSEDFYAGAGSQTEYLSTIDSARRANVAFYTVDVKGLDANPIGGTSELREQPSKGLPEGCSCCAASPSLTSVLASLTGAPASAGLDSQRFLLSSMFQQTGGGQGTGGQGSGRTTPGGSGSGAPPPGGSGSRGGPAPGTSPSTPGTNTGSGNVRGGRTGDTSQPDFPQFSQQRMDNMLRSIASDTGGAAIFNTSDFNNRLNEITRELDNYYVLGFQSNNPKRDGKFRKLEVRTDVKGIEVRHREGYLDPRPLDVLAGSRSEKSIMSAIASPAGATQLPVTFRALYFYDSPGLARIPVSAKIRAASLEMKKKGGQLAGDINVMGVAYAEDGSVSARFSETMHLVVDKEKEADFRKQNIAYRNHFRLRPGKYRLKLAIADEKGKIGSAEQSLAVPPLTQGDLAASSLVLAEKVTRLPALIQDLQMKLLDDSDPLMFNGMQVMPSVENEFSGDEPVGAVFKIYNLSGAAGKRNLVAQIQLTNEKGDSQTLPPIPLDDHLYLTGKTEGLVGIRLPLSKVTPGKYRLLISASEGASSRALSLQTDVLFK